MDRKRQVLVSPGTDTVYVDRPPEHVSLLARDIAGNFVHHNLTERQLSKIAKRLEPKKGKDYGTHHHHHHHRAADGRISAEHLRALLDEIHVSATHAELRALAAVLSATESDHFSTSDSTASRLRELSNDPHLHVWSSEEWHNALRQERKKASNAARQAEYQHRLHKERVKLKRLANVKTKSGKGRDKSGDVHEKARKHLAKVERKRRRVFETKWKRVASNKRQAKQHKQRMEKEGHVHINFERFLFRLRQGKIDVPRLEQECERDRMQRSADQTSEPGVLARKVFYNILQSCCVGTKVTTKEFAGMSKILDPDGTGNVSYEDFLWALKRQRGNNGFTLELPQFIPASYQQHEPYAELPKPSEMVSSHHSSRQSTPMMLTPGIVVVGVVQAAGIKHGTMNTRVHVVAGNTERTTSTRWNSDCPTFNELWTCSAQGVSLVHLSLQECEGVGGGSGDGSGRGGTTKTKTTTRRNATEGIGSCSIPIRALDARVGISVDDRWYTLLRKGHYAATEAAAAAQSSTSTSQAFGGFSGDNIDSAMHTTSTSITTTKPPTTTEIRVITCVLPARISSLLVADRPGHHALGRVQWRSNPQMPVFSGVAFVLRGVLVLTTEPETYNLNDVGMDDDEEGLCVVDAFPLWGCSKTDRIERKLRVSVSKSAHGDIIPPSPTGNIVIDEDSKQPGDDVDHYYSDEDFEDFEDFEDEEKVKHDDNIEQQRKSNTPLSLVEQRHGVRMSTQTLEGIAISLAVRTTGASASDGGALLTELELFPSDCSISRLLRVVDAASEHYRPRGGWCVPNSMKGGGCALSGSRPFSCMLVEENMTKWPGALRVSRESITFSSTSSPLGNMSVEINMSNVCDVRLTGQSVMPPTNALAISVVGVAADGSGRRQILEHTFTTFPSAGLALQCIMENVREYNQIRFTAIEMIQREKMGVTFPGVDLPSKSAATAGNNTRNRMIVEVTPKGFSKIENFYHDTLLDENHHFGPKGRHSPVVQRVLGLVIVDNLEPATATPTPPSSSSRARRSRAGKSPRRRKQKKANASGGASGASASTSRSSSRTVASQQPRNQKNNHHHRTHWTKDIEILSLLNFMSGSGRPFTQLVRHKPSRNIFALHVIPSKTQNMFELARQAVVALRVDHPNICRCYGTTQVGESIQFLWERGPTTMADAIQRSHLEDGQAPARAEQWTAELIRALSHLHSLGIVHRNVLTKHIMIMHDGSLRLNSFGISKYLARGRTTTICGEPTNMSPERVLGKPHGFAVDWWSVGLVMHELHAGIPLFPLESALFSRDDPAVNSGSGSGSSSMGIYERIVGCRYQVAESVQPPLADCIRRLVAHEEYRLGVSGRDREISCGAEILLYLATRQWWAEDTGIDTDTDNTDTDTGTDKYLY